jgi:hypothetical protein
LDGAEHESRRFLVNDASSARVAGKQSSSAADSMMLINAFVFVLANAELVSAGMLNSLLLLVFAW